MKRKVEIDAAGALHQVIMRGIEYKNILEENICLDSFVNRLGQEKTC